MPPVSGSAASGDDERVTAGAASDEAAIGEAFATLFADIEQLGPGSPATRLAVLERLRTALRAAPAIADMGCGAGAASLVLARALPEATIIAIDNHPGFLARLAAAADAETLRIKARNADMAAPGLPSASLDLIWCESAIYSIGRKTALAAWRPLLRTAGRIAFSDVVWLNERPPAALSAFWGEEYPAMTTPDGVAAEILEAGYRLASTLVAPVSDWQAYYAPLRQRLDVLRPQAEGALAAVIDGMAREIAIFDQHAGDYASVWFIAALDQADG